MTTKLFDEIIFGPIKSRRLGVSLGINLLPIDCKICNFDCIYCECGWTSSSQVWSSKENFHGVELVTNKLEEALLKMLEKGIKLDHITFAGNGEPTLHPNFDKVVDQVIELRDKYYPKSQIAVLTNSTLLKKSKVKKALFKVDACILKLDAGTDRMFQLINKPIGGWVLDKIEGFLRDFKGEIIIQTIFFKGQYNGVEVDNTKKEEIQAWLERIKRINPKHVMLYTIDRATPAKGLSKVDVSTLENISKKLKEINVSSSYS